MPRWIPLFLLLAVGLWPAAAQEPPYFLAGRELMTPRPSGAASGDINQDGLQDLVLSTLFDAAVVWLANPDGTYREGPLVDGGGDSAECVSLADFNTDGFLDLVACKRFGTGTYFALGRGDGSFPPLSVIETGRRTRSIVVADLNRDLILDLAIATELGASVLLGSGDGSFSLQTDFEIPHDPWGLVVADFNLDGWPDVLVTHEDGLTLFPGAGNGELGPAQDIEFPAGGAEAISEDFNRDGKPDLALNCNEGCHAVLLGNGDGTFGEPQYFFSDWVGRGVDAGDVNGDGHLDLAFSNYYEPVSIYLGDGSGSFRLAGRYEVGAGAKNAILADLRGNGLLDLVIPKEWSNAVSILYNRGDGRFNNLLRVREQSKVTAFRQLDLNGDGRRDLVAAMGDGLRIYHGTGNLLRPFAEKVHKRLGECRGVVAGGFGQHGEFAIAVLREGGDVLFFRPDGGGDLKYWKKLATGSTEYGLEVGDFNADGVLDLLTDDVYLFYGLGGAEFGPPILLTEYPGWSKFLIPRDIDGDGIDDLLYTATHDHPKVRYGSATGIGPPFDLEPFGSTAIAAAVLDLDRDGLLDVATISSANILSMFYSGGARDFEMHWQSMGKAGSNDYYELTAADFDGDGWADIAASVPDTASIDVLLGTPVRGEMDFAGSHGTVPFPARIQAAGVHAGTRKGYADLIVGSADDVGFSVLVNRTPAELRGLEVEEE